MPELPQPDHGSRRPAGMPRGLTRETSTDLDGASNMAASSVAQSARLNKTQHARPASVVTPATRLAMLSHFPCIPLLALCHDPSYGYSARLRASGHPDASAGAHAQGAGRPPRWPHSDSRQPSRQSCFMLAATATHLMTTLAMTHSFSPPDRTVRQHSDPPLGPAPAALPALSVTSPASATRPPS